MRGSIILAISPRTSATHYTNEFTTEERYQHKLSSIYDNSIRGIVFDLNPAVKITGIWKKHKSFLVMIQLLVPKCYTLVDACCCYSMPLSTNYSMLCKPTPKDYNWKEITS